MFSWGGIIVGIFLLVTFIVGIAVINDEYEQLDHLAAFNVNKDSKAKTQFANNARNFDKEAFQNFKPLFEQIREIMNSHIAASNNVKKVA